MIDRRRLARHVAKTVVGDVIDDAGGACGLVILGQVADTAA